MIPESLTLKGIYSYQEKEQTIDFTKLSSSGLFGIFGAVGSGKSTILEAISYALYGETERLNSRDNRSYNMMNLKSDQFLVDFIFFNAADKHKYRFTAKTSRNKKRHETVNPVERSAFKLINGEWIPISAKSAEEICGLSYLNFRRTIIIPQGRFQEFLQLGDTDRSKMMKELFHLEKFDLAGKTKFLEEKNDSILENIKGQLAQLEDISAEKLVEIENETDITKASLESAVKEVQLLSAEIDALKQLKAIVEKIAIGEESLEQLKKQLPAIEILKKDLQQFQQCSKLFSEPLNRLRDYTAREKMVTDEIVRLKNQFREIEQQLARLEPMYAALKLRYENREELKKQIADCQKMLETRTLDQEIGKLKERVEKGGLEIAKTVDAIKQQETKKSGIKDQMLRLKASPADFVELAGIKAWYVSLNSCQKEFSALERDLVNLEKQKDAKLESILLIGKKTGLLEKDIPPEKLVLKIAGSIHQLEIDADLSEEELKKLKIKQELLSYSQQLKDGEACPVCGSTNHPEKMEAKNLSENLDRAENKLSGIRNELKTLKEIEKELQLKTVEYQAIINAEKETGLKLEASRLNIEQQEDSYHFKTKIDEAGLEKAFQDAENQKKEIDKAEKELMDIEKQLESELKNKERFQAVIHDLNLAIGSKSANLHMLKGQIDIRVFEEFNDMSAGGIETKISSLEQEYHKRVADFHSTEKEIDRLRPERERFFGTIESKEKDIDLLKSEIEELEAKLNIEISRSAYGSLAGVRQILEKSIDPESETQKIVDFETRLFNVTDQLEKLKQQSAGKPFEPEIYLQKLSAQEVMNRQLSDFHKKLGSLEEEKRKQAQKLQEKSRLRADNEFHMERAENISTLKSLFKGSGFVNYISSVYLQNLVNAANVRFLPLTGQKLRLELTGTNDFIIRDYLNEGRTRSVKTLSGGQTFQASLSLALALADSIQSVNKSEDNFFFLDEGFGSLDKEALASVFESLKSLRRENRIVGIISHVEEMQQEIDNYLKIENLANEGSLIRASWD